MCLACCAQVPTAGGTFITLYARNLGNQAPRTTLSVIFRGELLETPVVPKSDWVLLSSRTMELPASPTPREAQTYVNHTDGIK